MTNHEGVVLGLDLGTSGLKAVALDESGAVLARARRAYPTSRPVVGAAEQSPQDWWDAAVSAMRELAQAVQPSRWRAIGLSAMLPTLVGLDDRNRPVGQAITWEDARAQEEGDALRDAIGASELYARTGQRIDGRYLLPMSARRAAASVNLLGGDPVRTICGAKDYLLFLLTGELLTDPSTAAGYGAYDLERGGWDERILAAGAPEVAVPAIAASNEYRPLVASVAAEVGCAAGIPVVLGSADSVAGAYGLGLRSSGGIAYIAGSSNAIIGQTDHALLDSAQRYLVTPMAERGFGIEMDLLSTGSAMAWMAGLFGLSGGAAELASLAADSPVESAPIVLPYLAPGEQGALWDDSLAGAIRGLSVHTSRADLARGLVSGIIVESRRCLGILDEVLGDSAAAGELFVSGSSASSELFRQDLADASGHPVMFFPGENDHSALGAALLAARAGFDAEIPPQSSAQSVEPDDRRSARWADLADACDDFRIAAAVRQKERA